MNDENAERISVSLVRLPCLSCRWADGVRSVWTLSVDQYEFESVHTEESLTIMVCRTSQFEHGAGLLGFTRHALDMPDLVDLPAPTILAPSTDVIDNLKRFTNLLFPENCLWPVYFVFEDWDRRRAVIDAGDCYVAYDWSSSA